MMDGRELIEEMRGSANNQIQCRHAYIQREHVTCLVTADLLLRLCDLAAAGLAALDLQEIRAGRAEDHIDYPRPASETASIGGSHIVKGVPDDHTA